MIILAGSGEKVRKDGQIDGVNGISDYAFTTTYKETNKSYIFRSNKKKKKRKKYYGKNNTFIIKQKNGWIISFTSY